MKRINSSNQLKKKHNKHDHGHHQLNIRNHGHLLKNQINFRQNQYHLQSWQSSTYCSSCSGGYGNSSVSRTGQLNSWLFTLFFQSTYNNSNNKDTRLEIVAILAMNPSEVNADWLETIRLGIAPECSGVKIIRR